MIIKAVSTRMLSTRAYQSAACRPNTVAASQAWQILSLPVNKSKKIPVVAPCNSFFKGLRDKKVSTASCNQYYSYMQEMMMTSKPSRPQTRMFSAGPLNDAMATSATSFPHLTAPVIKQIKKDIDLIDENNDGLMQPEEFRKLLQMHKTSFTEHEIDIITESFYAGTAGSGVAFDRFVEALDVAASKTAEKGAVAKKLGIGSCGAEYILGSKAHSYTAEELAIQLTHKPPKDFTNHLSFRAVKAVRYLFDLGTGWNGDITTKKIMNRVIYLETIAAVPGMVAGILRHFKSLRAMERDGGMLNMFLEEALNERMHLLTFVKMKNPGFIMRSAVLGGQVGFGFFYGLAYVLSPKFCHTFVGYVEEEACATYTKIIKAIEEAPEGDELAAWRTELAPKIGRAYWHLGENGTVLDLMYAIRADEAEHRDVNHFASEAKPGELAPVGNPQKQVDMALKKYVKDLMTV